jgi:hypothetical protein
VNYLIKQSEVARLAAAREIQTRQAAEDHFRETGQGLGDTQPQACREWANVRWVNGTVTEQAFPIGKVAKWAGLLGLGLGRFSTPRGQGEIEIEFLPDNRVALRAGPSSMTVCVGGENYRLTLGPAIPVVAPGRDFTVEADTSSLKAARKQASENKKLANARKRYAEARRAEKFALGNLRTAAAEHVANMETCGAIIAPLGIVFSLGHYDAAFETAKRILDARRMLRRSLAAPEVLPSWLPATHQEQRTETVDKLNPDGSRMVDDIFRGSYDKAVAMGEYLATLGAKPEIPDYYFERENVTFTATVDTHAEHAGLVAQLHAARDARAAYTPRAAKYSWPRRHAKNPPLRKHEKLDLEIKEAADYLETFLRTQYNHVTQAAGLGRLGDKWFSVRDVRGYSIARQAVRTWKERKAELAAKYLTARDERKQVAL